MVEKTNFEESDPPMLEKNISKITSGNSYSAWDDAYGEEDPNEAIIQDS